MKMASGVERQLTPREIEAELGECLKKLRVHRNLDQATLAARAGHQCSYAAESRGW